MKTHIITINVNNHVEITRTDLEDIGNETFNNNAEITDRLGSDKFKLYSMSDFMDLCNNEEFDLSKHFVGYINMPEGYYYV